MLVRIRVNIDECANATLIPKKLSTSEYTHVPRFFGVHQLSNV